MAIFKKKKVESTLKKKGFKKENSHHKYFRLFVDDKDTGIFTKTSHGGNSIEDFHISCMTQELGLDKKEFPFYWSCN